MTVRRPAVSKRWKARTTGRAGLAFVVVTHLTPDRESLLHEIVARYTRMPAQVAADRMDIENNRVRV